MLPQAWGYLPRKHRSSWALRRMRLGWQEGPLTAGVMCMPGGGGQVEPGIYASPSHGGKAIWRGGWRLAPSELLNKCTPVLLDWVQDGIAMRYSGTSALALTYPLPVCKTLLGKGWGEGDQAGSLGHQIVGKQAAKRLPPEVMRGRTTAKPRL